MNKFAIYDGNMPKFEKALNRIKNKCIKYNCPFVYNTVGEEFKTETISRLEDGTPLEHDIEITRRFIIIEVEAHPVIANWELIASLEHTKEGNIIHSINNNINIPERYYNVAPCCEHCNTNRRRKNSFIIHNTVTNEFKQVGKTCLNDFTGNVNAEWLASFYSAFEKLATFEAPQGGYNHTDRYFPVIDLLTYTVAVTNIYGYCKSGMRNATGETVKDFYIVNECKGYPFKEVNDHIKEKMQEVNFKVTEEDTATAEKIIAYVNSIEDTNNYIHNIKTLCASDMVAYRNVNLLVSAITCYNRDLERKAKAEARKKEVGKSKHIGNVKDRLTINIASWRCLTSWCNCYDGYNETTTFLYQFIDNDGNIFTWKTQKHFDEDATLQEITGTVKAHNVFRDAKQTELTRCKVR